MQAIAVLWSIKEPNAAEALVAALKDEKDNIGRGGSRTALTLALVYMKDQRARSRNDRQKNMRGMFHIVVDGLCCLY